MKSLQKTPYRHGAAKMIEDGFYWIKLEDSSEWTIAELEGGTWWVIGSGDRWEREHISELGPKIKQPE